MTLDGPHSGLYRAQVSGIALPDAAGVTSFREGLSLAERAQLERVVATWTSPQDLVAPDRLPTETSEYVVDGIARNTHRFLLPAGPRTIRAMEIEPAPGKSDAWRAARLKLLWESDDRAAGVDLPLGFAFARLPEVEPWQSLLEGSNGLAWSNRFPMPYQRQAFLQIDSETAIRGTIRVRSARGVALDAAYFRAAYREGVALRPPKVTNPPIAFEFSLSGRGHYAGAMITARCPAQGLRGPTSALFVIPGVGTDLVINGGPIQLTGWDTTPAQGLFLGPVVPGLRLAAGYRWHVADPVPFVRPIHTTIQPDTDHWPTADVAAAVAVFWYSERPGPEPDGP
jgi:hypothetical protein